MILNVVFKRILNKQVALGISRDSKLYFVCLFVNSVWKDMEFLNRSVILNIWKFWMFLWLIVIGVFKQTGKINNLLISC